MYGQQFSNPIASAAKWLFLGFAGIVVMAILLGTNIKDATWLNPNIAEAEAQRIQIESAHQQATYSLQEQLAQAQTQAEIQKIQGEMKLQDAEYEHDIQALNQDLAHRDISFKAWMTVLNWVGGALAIAIILGTILWTGSKALVNIRTAPVSKESITRAIPPVEKTIHPLPERETYDPWISPTYRRQRIKAARQEERKQRKEEIIIHMEAFKDPAHISKEKYNKYPLAG